MIPAVLGLINHTLRLALFSLRSLNFEAALVGAKIGLSSNLSSTPQRLRMLQELLLSTALELSH